MRLEQPLGVVMVGSKWWASVLLVGCVETVETEAAGPEDDLDFETEWETDDEGGCPDSWVLTYAIDGRVDITHTPLNIGNADALVGGLEMDELVLRLADDGGSPAEGQVLVTHFELLQDFQVSVNMWGEIAIITDLLSTASDECGLSSGELDGSTVTWDDCSFGAEHGTTSWSPDEGAYGPGCISDYHVEGIVECVDDALLASCSDGWLDEGDNVLDYVYNQPMLSLEFDSDDLESFTMKGTDYGTELPTFTNNRTWLSLNGELKSMSLEPTPDCLCAE
jgi:hypothetical protein